MRDPFVRRVDSRTQLTLQFGAAWLMVVGIAHASDDWNRVFTVWALGRPRFFGLAPKALTVTLGATAVLYFLGVHPRWTGLVACGLLAGIYALVPATYHNNTYVLFLFVLVTAAWAHAEYTLGWFARGGSPAPGDAPAVVPWLVRAQLLVIYLGSVLVKLCHPWWRGTGQVILWSANEHVPQDIPGWWNIPLRPLLGNPHGAAFADTLVTAAEVLIPLGLLTSRRRRLALGAAVCLHTFMQEWLFPQLFTFLMLLGLYAYVPSGDHGWTVTYDPAHPLDRTLVRLFDRLDWLARTRWIPNVSARDLTAVHTDGTLVTGASVLRLLAVLTPVTLFVWATLSLAAGGTLTLFTLPRPALENMALLVVALAYVPGVLDGVYRAARRRME